MMLRHEEIDEFCLMCDAQSRERWRPLQNPLESSLGEKTELTNLSRTQLGHELSMIGSTAGTAVGSTGPQEGWTECFQDLHTWCPPPQDELNTPQVTTECFNFGTIDQCQVRGLDDLYPVDLMPDTLGGDMAMPPLGLEEENNNNTPPYLKLPQTSTSSGGKLYTSFPVPTKSPLKSTSANILLSQSVMEAEKKPFGFESYKVRGGMDDFYVEEGISFDSPEDEENFLLVPPDQVARRQEFRVPVRTDVTVKKERPKLKLDITLPTPPAVVMPSTPEVQNELSEPKVGFDLIKYVVSGDYVNVGTVGGVAPTSKVYESVKRDHDYTDPGSKPNPLNDFFVVKSEPISPEEHNQPEKKTERRPIKRRSDSNSEYIFDSDFCNSDESKDWEPSTSKGRKPPKAKKPKKSPKVRDDSDAESVASSSFTDKYRELRDKNNEASRRSRLNRKQRDMETKRMADKLESRNRALRARSERMQKLVLEVRETIMRNVKNANKR